MLGRIVSNKLDIASVALAVIAAVLLQPYNAGTQIKSGTYQVIMWVAYMVCYMMIQIIMPTLIFGVMTIIFCVLYCIVASVLVYKLAPKAFRIRT